ncbi:efflux RND transporter periplasmic adaptor subunit [Azospirillum thermophilum]|uniref:Efflux RND transporter periplasmic adaptor subunit n=1 Tax=Azospirillum thermophilum TaxID=2202148 RepID=A0A2S2D061_9PROT|nr:efflux RND transporter periplasmic adaptor subunit [Azospirillum thermophilum]AWK90151.1 efflux RND transporter periplasmic adaptor subunit [Azospirillum thermophilum]
MSSKKSIRWKPVVTGLILAVLVGGVGYAVQDRLTAPPQGQAGPPGGGRGGAVPVVAGIAAREDVPVWLDGIGTVQAFNSAVVRARADGEILQLPLKEGQLVKAGDLLAQIDPRPYKAQLAQAEAKKAQDEAQLANARRDLDRTMNLREYASRQSADTQRAQVAALEAQVRADEAVIENARVQLGYTTVTAPISGRIGLRTLDVGNIVRAGDQSGLATITQVQPIAVVFTLPEKLLPTVLESQAAGEAAVQALDREGRRPLGNGTLAVVDNQIDQTTGTIRLKATMPNEPQRLWPGQFVNVRLLAATRRGATTVPATVVQRGPQGTYAYLVKEDMTVEPRPIRVGLIESGKAVIEEGLKPGDRVVVDGQYRLQPGSRVRLTDAPAGSGAAAPAVTSDAADPAAAPAGPAAAPREERRRQNRERPAAEQAVPERAAQEQPNRS